MGRDDQKHRSEQVRQSILDTALDIGMKEGFEAVSIRKIVQAMKYSTGIVYHHFRDKQDIIDAIEVSQSALMHAKIVAVMDNTKDVIHNMEAIYRCIMHLAFTEPEKYNLIVLQKYSMRKATKPQGMRMLERQLQEGMQQGLIKRVDLEHLAFCVWSSFLGFNLMVSRQTDLTLEQVDAMFQTQFKMIMKGILSHE